MIFDNTVIYFNFQKHTKFNKNSRFSDSIPLGPMHVLLHNVPSSTSCRYLLRNVRKNNVNGLAKKKEMQSKIISRRQHIL